MMMMPVVVMVMMVMVMSHDRCGVGETERRRCGGSGRCGDLGISARWRDEQDDCGTEGAEEDAFHALQVWTGGRSGWSGRSRDRLWPMMMVVVTTMMMVAVVMMPMVMVGVDGRSGGCRQRGGGSSGGGRGGAGRWTGQVPPLKERRWKQQR